MAASREEKKKDEIFDEQYVLVSLPNNKDQTLALAQLEIKGGNAVLLYPGLENNLPHKACFIRKGRFLTTQNDQKQSLLKKIML